mmetsp:Transcript_39309/g.113721  ORF Transcript_39309/g.113721 Transcript_39309/m.113721 type:complete len:147 (-) Transcript_39309:115-555(-)
MAQTQGGFDSKGARFPPDLDPEWVKHMVAYHKQQIRVSIPIVLREAATAHAEGAAIPGLPGCLALAADNDAPAAKRGSSDGEAGEGVASKPVAEDRSTGDRCVEPLSSNGFPLLTENVLLQHELDMMMDRIREFQRFLAEWGIHLP